MNKTKRFDELWAKYNETRLRGLKKDANRMLPNVIDYFHELSRDTQESFVHETCAKLLEISDPSSSSDWMLANNGSVASEQAVRIQHQVFCAAILPILLDGFRKNDPHCIRWIAQFFPFIYSDKSLWRRIADELNLEKPVGPWFFLERSYALHSSPRTLLMMLSLLFEGMRYACHELPCGILMECGEFEKDIEELKYWLSKASSGFQKKHADEVAYYEKMAYHWTKYRMGENNQAGFEDYLVRNGVEWK